MIDKTRLPEMARALEAVLAHVPFDGWTDLALERAMADLGEGPETARLLFPKGASDALRLFSKSIDDAMVAALAAQPLSNLPMTQRIHKGVMLRFELLAPYREAVRRGALYLARPDRAPLGLQLTARTADIIWRAAGDTATDYNFYTKRGLLAGVYLATLPVWLDDESEDQAVTADYLERRLKEVVKIGGRTGKTMKALLDLPDRLAQRVTQGLTGRPSRRGS